MAAISRVIILSSTPPLHPPHPLHLTPLHQVSAELTNATNLAIELEAEKRKWTATGSDDFDEILRRLLAIRKRQLEDIKAINTLPLTSANREFISKNIKHIRQRIEERKALRK